MENFSVSYPNVALENRENSKNSIGMSNTSYL